MAAAGAAQVRTARPSHYGVRPERPHAAARRARTVPGEVVVVEPTGAETELLVQVGHAQVTLVTYGRPGVNPGERVGLRVEPGMAHLFDQNRPAAHLLASPARGGFCRLVQ